MLLCNYAPLERTGHNAYVVHNLLWVNNTRTGPIIKFCNKCNVMLYCFDRVISEEKNIFADYEKYLTEKKQSELNITFSRN